MHPTVICLHSNSKCDCDNTARIVLESVLKYFCFFLPSRFRDKIKILHFAGKLKPWLIQFNSETKTAATPTDYSHAHDLIQHWWTIFCDHVHQGLSDVMVSFPLHHLLLNSYQLQSSFKSFLESLESLESFR